MRLTMDDLHDLLASLRHFCASAQLRDVLDVDGVVHSISRKPVFLVRGAEANANNAGGEDEPVFDDLDRVHALFSREKAPC